MTRAVLICPGRGTYNATELGYLGRHHAERGDLIASFDALRSKRGRETVSTLDAADRFSLAKYTRGDIASPLICACSLADALALRDEIEVVAITGNSMGWYLALAAGGALTPQEGFRLVDTMGGLMQEHLIGGQIVYPWMPGDWTVDLANKSRLLTLVSEIDARAGCALSLSIDLGGMLVLAGDEAGLSAFELAVPRLGDRFPMRLPNHAGFHAPMQDPVAQMGRAAFGADFFNQPSLPLIDGRGHLWWPQACNLEALWSYTLGAQVTEPYDFSAAIRMAAREFAPDLFIITGPGSTMGGAVAQSLIACGWKGMRSKAEFDALQAQSPLLISMGRDDQRALVV